MGRPELPHDLTLPIPEPIHLALVEAAGGLRLALVGGAVRDLLLHRVHRDPWRGLPDLDLVVEDPARWSPATLPGGADAVEASQAPAAHRLAASLEARDPGALGFCRLHGAYGTAELELHGILLDLATARRESYPEPGANPLVRAGALEDDLARRDFSINAMAVLLEAGGPRLLDPHGGLADLEQRRLRLLHPRSVADDPTRLLRGARYGARLGFTLEATSLEQVSATLAAWPWRWRHGDPPPQAPPALATRLRMELELLLEREPWPRALALLQQWGALVLLDPALQVDRRWRQRMRRAERLGLSTMVGLVAGASEPLALAERLQLPHRQHKLLAQWLRLRQRLLDLEPQVGANGRGWTPSRWAALLEDHGLGAEAVALALACGDGPRRPLLRWWLRWRQLRAPQTAAELVAAGMHPGPALGERLRQLRADRLDRERL